MESTRYRHKPKVVDAIEVAKIVAAAANGTADMLPKWVRDAVFEKRLEISRNFAGVVVYPLPQVPRMGASRDYVLHDPIDNTINACPPETLRDLYEPVE